MSVIGFQDVTPGRLPLLQTALERLSAELGDRHRMEPEVLRAALFGEHPSGHAVLALGAGNTLCGAALFSPVVSTSTGAAGAYLSDLWVSETARGQSLGQRLLAEVGKRAQALWQARFIRLVSYASNPRAGTFYDRLGFRVKAGEHVLQLPQDDFGNLVDET